MTDSPKVHCLKCWPQYFEPLVDGRKNFEIRNNDRDFRVGDKLRIQEWKPNGRPLQGGEYTGREVGRVITYMTDFEQCHGFVVLGIKG